MDGAEKLALASENEKLVYSKACFDKAKTATIKWIEKVGIRTDQERGFSLI